jgi:hypothetical protein
MSLKMSKSGASALVFLLVFVGAEAHAHAACPSKDEVKKAHDTVLQPRVDALKTLDAPTWGDPLSECVRAAILFKSERLEEAMSDEHECAKEITECPNLGFLYSTKQIKTESENRQRIEIAFTQTPPNEVRQTNAAGEVKNYYYADATPTTKLVLHLMPGEYRIQYRSGDGAFSSATITVPNAGGARIELPPPVVKPEVTPVVEPEATPIVKPEVAPIVKPVVNPPPPPGDTGPSKDTPPAHPYEGTQLEALVRGAWAPGGGLGVLGLRVAHRFEHVAILGDAGFALSSHAWGIDLRPSVAWRALEQLEFGVVLDLMPMHVNLEPGGDLGWAFGVGPGLEARYRFAPNLALAVAGEWFTLSGSEALKREIDPHFILLAGTVEWRPG